MRIAKVERNLASQAGLWYTKLRNNVVPSGAVNTLGRINPTGRSIMATISPHADHGNLIPNASGIYTITCTANKRIYIGSTSNLQVRRNSHFNSLRQNKHHNPIMQNAWNKYGEQSFVFEVLELVLPMDPTNREQYWLNKFKPYGRKGFNIAHDARAPMRGTNGRKDSPETIERKRLAQATRNVSPENLDKMRKGSLGRKQSPDHIKKRTQSRPSKKCSPETREKIRQSHSTPEYREKQRQATLARWAREKKEQ